ncbi:MATE family efflux transporter [Clostridium botulinum C]|uniref:Probable multidrug resistance protein NorM n=2 Tax=Clostridium botulinum TaxID=1491 RepID=A0A9Q4TQ24_CLOBO|nr:MATE family efflux transporter [Clostridium botulinum]EGO88642.1 multidrug transporter MATE [Clostridium botulinum C str. Stockholm]MCD3195502.1 MATE family efflux transporter [Clostridium botulinum C]MCD3200918.1 MATE family efflux transporter [Clostridium botulinum C]MCD3206325.1 MATE family efflux transporter [Clostridium botulinum C]MCD3208901.1 MATE family efflux transporter [Clostridium botulinum C]
MKGKNNKKLFEGNILKNLLKMSIPTMLGYLFQSAYDLVDLIWIGKISSSAVAAATIFTTIFWTVDILNEIIGTSSVSVISQSYGTGDNEKTTIAIEQTLIFKALVAVIAAILMFIFLKPLISFFTDDPIVRENALEYGYIRIFFLPIMFSSFTINTAFRCIGDAKKPMIVMIVAAIFNVVLDPLFMFENIPGTHIPGFNMGIFGAALATVISTTIAFLLALVIFITQEKHIKLKFKRLFKLDWNTDKKLLTIGVSSGFQMLSKNLAGIMVLKFVAFYGTDSVAAIGIGNKLCNFTNMPILGLSMGASAIVGQCLGGNKIEKAKEAATKAGFLGIIIMTFSAMLIFVFPNFIMKIFISNDEVISIGTSMLRIISLGLIATGLTMGIGSVFPGSGYNLPYFIASFIARWCGQIPLLYLVVRVIKLPIIGVWWVFAVADILEMIVVIVFYKKGKWENNRV